MVVMVKTFFLYISVSALAVLILAACAVGGRGDAGTSTPIASAAPTFYVSTSGNDTNDGSQNAPWRTIQHALDRLQPGQTVYVRAGTYNEYVEFRRSGAPDAPITLAGFSGEAVVLDGRGLNWRYAVSLESFDSLIVQNLTVRDYIRDGLRGNGIVGWGDTDSITLRDLNISLVETPIKFAADGSDEVRSNLIIENITAVQYDGGGIDFGPGPVSNVTVRNVRLNGPSGGNDTAVDGIAVERGNQILLEKVTLTGHAGDGIDLKADNVIVRQADVRGYGRNGVKLWGATTTLENSLFVNSQGEHPVLVLAGVGPYNIRHNLFSGAAGHGYAAEIGPYEASPGTPPTQVALQGNIFCSTKNTGTLIYFSRVTVLESNYNLYYAPRRTDEILAAFPGGSYRTFSAAEINDGTWASVLRTDQASRFADALFVDPESGDYRLRQASPAVDIVPARLAPAVDLLGRARPQGMGADAGPYEFTDGGSITFRLSARVKGRGTVVSEPAGLKCPEDCVEDYASGTQVTLRAVPAAGWRFVGWREACSGAQDCAVSMTDNRSVMARFKRVR